MTLLTIFVALVGTLSPQSLVGNVERLRIDVGYPVGWYDSLDYESSLSQMAAEGLDAVIPYDVDGGDVDRYLNTAERLGVRVIVEIPRFLVLGVNGRGIETFVRRYERHRALLGWYLADEPSTNREFGPLRPPAAESLYRAIKRVDLSHPVVMAFTRGEDAASYRRAADVMAFDDYPCFRGTPEFDGLSGWTTDLDHAARTGDLFQGFFPVLQGYGGAFGRRLPTQREESYMAYSAIMSGASGLYFWAHYRANGSWVARTIVPLATELKTLRNAVNAGSVAHAVRVDREEVRVAAFRDRSHGKAYLVLVRRGIASGPVRITFDGVFDHQTRVRKIGDASRWETISHHSFTVRLGPYGAAAFELA
jgi:hypothetical protein